MKKHMKAADGKYHIKVDGKMHKFDKLEGSRAEVHHKKAYKTAGGLTKKDLIKNKHGNIVSLKKHKTAKKEKRLEKHGYFAKKGKFGYVKKTAKKTRSNKKKTKKNKKGILAALGL
jgi:hypothetical protein